MLGRVLFGAMRNPLRRRRDALVPSRELVADAPRTFIAAGDAWLLRCVTLGGLVPDARVLELGCGYGRAARPLTDFLSADGHYLGFDLDEAAIGWCTERYAAYPNFAFQHADLANPLYRPSGTEQASEYLFPSDDGNVELVLAASVLTHLVTAELARYLRETARVLAPGGRALLALFLLDLGSRAALTQGRATLPFDLASAAGPMVVVIPSYRRVPWPTTTPGSRACAPSSVCAGSAPSPGVGAD